MDVYADSLAQLLAELEWLDVLVRVQVSQARHLQQADDRFAGLYVSEEQVDSLLAEPAGLPRWATLTEARVGLDEVSQGLAARASASVAAGVSLRLERLTSLFGLDRLERSIVVVCVAPELHRRYERLFAYLQDDVTKRRPSVDLVLDLLCDSFVQKLTAIRRFTPEGALIRHRLVELVEDPAYPRAPLVAQYLKLDDRITRYLLDSDEIDVQLRPFVWLAPQRPESVPARFEPALDWALERACAEHARSGSLLMYLRGPRGVGKKTWADALCRRLGLGLLVVDAAFLAGGDKDNCDLRMRLVLREAALQSRAICWDNFDTLLTTEREAPLRTLVKIVAETPGVSFFSGTAAWQAASTHDIRSCLHVEFPHPTQAERLGLWRSTLGAALHPEVAAELPVVAGTFRLTPGQVQNAAASASERARWRDPNDPRPDVEDIYVSCRALSNPKLSELAKKIETCFAWDDLVLPADAIRQLREVCDRVRHSARVLETWGFEHKLSYGKGLSALFSGPSGTGKTMAAEIMARELGLDLYKIDLSGVVSKYIGETEKNLARVFAEAETSSAILFFDEADALFGKRSEVKDAHDRYANVETSYLLQRMEEYPGITVLATNLRRNMDEAFLRRLAFVVQFPMPEEAERLRIWNGVFPEATPRHEDVNFEFMAKQFKLSGGNIKNIALAAAFLAASDDNAVTMVHVVQATRRELTKMGKSCVAGEFGEYAGAVAE